MPKPKKKNLWFYWFWFTIKSENFINIYYSLKTCFGSQFSTTHGRHFKQSRLWQRMTAILILFRIKSASRKDLPKTWKFIIKCQNVLQYFAEINRLRTWSFCYTALVSCQNFFIDISIKINQFCWFSLSKKHIYI